MLVGIGWTSNSGEWLVGMSRSSCRPRGVFARRPPLRITFLRRRNVSLPFRVKTPAAAMRFWGVMVAREKRGTHSPLQIRQRGHVLATGAQVQAFRTQRLGV
jgi:hypothetical protein